MSEKTNAELLQEVGPIVANERNPVYELLRRHDATIANLIAGKAARETVEQTLGKLYERMDAVCEREEARARQPDPAAGFDEWWRRNSALYDANSDDIQFAEQVWHAATTMALRKVQAEETVSRLRPLCDHCAGRTACQVEREAIAAAERERMAQIFSALQDCDGGYVPSTIAKYIRDGAK